MLAQLEEIALERSKGFDDDDFTLRGLWRLDHRYRPNTWERLLTYTMVLAQTEAQGCAYAEYGSAEIEEDLLGQDCREVRPRQLTTRIAALDAVYGVFADEPDAAFTFTGTSSAKAVRRAEIVVEEVERLLERTEGRRVLNIGVMGNFLHLLGQRGVTVTGSDYDQELVSSGMNGVRVEHGRRTLDLIEEHDVVLATGMTLVTNTLPDIVERVRETGRRLVLFAATGSHFGREYCRTFGVDVVVSEPQPQYLFQGTTMIGVHRRDRSS